MKKEFELLKKVFDYNGWTWEWSEELEANINITRKNNMILFNYNDAVLVPRNHPVLVKCRGLVINDRGELLNHPFDRFFNDFEKEAPTIDWKSAEVIEKVDGSLICVFRNEGQWEITTRGSFYPRTDNSLDFAEEFLRLYNDLDKLNQEISYQFELVSKNNRIVTWYDEEWVVLIGARNNIFGNEYTQSQLRIEASFLNVPVAKTYSLINNKEEIKNLFSRLKPDEEGFVVRDGRGNRIKMKQESYIKLSRIKNLHDEDIFEYVMGRSEIDQEYLQKCPEVLVRIKEISNMVERVEEAIGDAFADAIDGLESDERKEYALKIQNNPYKKMLFLMYDSKSIRPFLKWKDVEAWSKL